MIRLIALVIVLWLPGNVAGADSETEEKITGVTCRESDSLASVKGGGLNCKMGRRFVWFTAGLQFPPEETILQFHLGKTMPVKYRFDRGAVQSGNWGYTGNVAFSRTDSTFIADGLRTAKTLVFKVGDSSTVRISLKGSTKAMKDFDKRCRQLRG